MSYQAERDQFIDRMSREGLPLRVTLALLRAATTLNRYAELACSSETADRDRVSCPGIKCAERCVCDGPDVYLCPCGQSFDTEAALTDHREEQHDTPRTASRLHPIREHQDVPRYRVLEARLERRIAALLAEVPYAQNNKHYKPWAMDTQGDPRGYVLRVIPPSYAERNAGRDRYNRDVIGVPCRESGIRW